jgi:hypothetical protein
MSIGTTLEYSITLLSFQFPADDKQSLFDGSLRLDIKGKLKLLGRLWDTVLYNTF